MNYLDTRDLYKRQCELQEELEALKDDVEEARELITEELEDEDPEIVERVEEAEKALSEWQAEYQEELDGLNTLESEIGREWMHGETLIPEDDFEEYAEDTAADMYGSQITDAAWPFSHIDWEAAADDLKQDYSEAEYQGTTYLFRAS